MRESAKEPRFVILCDRDDLYSSAGHPLSTTHYDYDRHGMIAKTTKQTYASENRKTPTDFPIREITWDAYQIVVSEDVFGENMIEVGGPRAVLYQKDQAGRVQWAVKAAADPVTGQRFPIYYTMGHENLRPHQRGHVVKEAHYSPDGKFAWAAQYEYDSHGWKVRTNRLLPDGSYQLGRRKIIAYDAHGNIVRYDNGRPFAVENIYDKNGLLKTALVREQNPKTGAWDFIVRHEYSYEKYLTFVPNSKIDLEPAE